MSTPKYIEFYINLFVIDDLPKTVTKLLNFMAGKSPLDVDIKLPDHYYFDDLDWHDWFRHTFDYSAVIPTFMYEHPRVVLVGAYPGSLHRLHSFISWMSDYIDGPRTLGTFRREGEIFPATLHVKNKEVGVTEVDRVMNHDGPLLIEPRKQLITDFIDGITFDDIMDMMVHKKSCLH
jgi:hypothetical protein